MNIQEKANEETKGPSFYLDEHDLSIRFGINDSCVGSEISIELNNMRNRIKALEQSLKSNPLQNETFSDTVNTEGGR